jgi:hypothetical protein
VSSGQPEQGAVPGARPAALLVVRITPDDVGRRVSVRRRLDATMLSDVVGHLLSWSDGVLRIERRDGTVTEVAAVDLVAAKVVPPAPARREGRPDPDGTRRGR